MKRLLLCLFAFFLFAGCSNRDFYESEPIKRYFAGPVIEIMNPLTESTQGFFIPVEGRASHESGVDYITIFSYGKEIVLKNSSLSDTFDFSTNVFVYGNNNSDIIIDVEAFNARGVSSKSSIPLHLSYLELSININDWNYYTNEINVTISGTVSDYSGELERMFAIVNETNKYEIQADDNWSVDVELKVNRYNYIRIFAYTENALGVYENYMVCDLEPPTVNFIFPQNNDTIARQGRIFIGAEDNFSPFQTYCSFDGINFFEMDFVSNNTWSYDYNLPSGNYFLYAYAIDYAGNISDTNRIAFEIDGSIPVAGFNPPYTSWFVTNDTILEVTGFAEVDTDYNIAQVFVSVNNGSFSEVSITPSSSVNWSKELNFIANQENFVRVYAVSSTGKHSATNASHPFLIDTQPPYIDPNNPITPAHNSVLVNTDTYNLRASFIDDLSGVQRILLTRSGTNVTEETREYWGDTFTDTFTMDGGGIAYDIFEVYDTAGNVAVFTNRVEVYPELYVSADFGDDDNWGFLNYPFASIQKAVDTASARGITNIMVAGGSYDKQTAFGGDNINVKINGINLLKISGGFNNDFSIQDFNNTPSVIQGQNSAKHVVLITNSQNIDFVGFALRDGGSLTPGSVGGGIAVYDSSGIRLLNIRCIENSSEKGPALFVYNSSLDINDFTAFSNSGNINVGAWLVDSQVTLNNATFDNNSLTGGVVEENLSLIASINTEITVDNSYLYMFPGSDINKNYSLLFVEGGGLDIINTDFNVSLSGFSGVTGNYYGIYINETPDDAHIIQNKFNSNFEIDVTREFYAFYEGAPLNGHIFKANGFYTGIINNWTAYYYDSENEGTTDIGDVNNPDWTGATDDSIGNNEFN
jgi:hypothetical protein